MFVFKNVHLTEWLAVFADVSEQVLCQYTVSVVKTLVSTIKKKKKKLTAGSLFESEHIWDYSPLSVCMALDTKRLQAWSAWWTTLLAQLCRSMSYNNTTYYTNLVSEKICFKFLLNVSTTTYLLFSVILQRNQRAVKCRGNHHGQALTEKKKVLNVKQFINEDIWWMIGAVYPHLQSTHPY